MINLNYTKKITLSMFSSIALYFSSANAQIGGGGDAFMQGDNIHIGIELLGGYEGADSPPPVTGTPWRYRGAAGLSGFVADPSGTSFSGAYNGDYYTPGTPENGWGLHIGAASGGATMLHCNRSGGVNAFNIGNSIAWSNFGGAENVCWNGTAITGTNNITANITYSLGINNLYYTTTVRFTNNSANTIPIMYYYRTLDPDNNQSIGTGFATTNSITSQPTSAGSCGIAQVSASQLASGAAPASYMSLAGVGADFRVSRAGFANRNGFDIWNGTGGLINTVGTVATADQAISLAYRIQNFLPGTSRFFSFVTILRPADVSLALNSLMTLSFPGVSASGATACNPASADTAYICGPSLIEVSGAGASSYSWSWNPPIGLSSSTTYSAIANPSVITNYTITGTPIPGPCAPGAPEQYTIVVVPRTPTTITNPTLTVCTGAPILLTGLAPAGMIDWSGPAGFTSTILNPTITPSTLANSGTYTVTNNATCMVGLTPVVVTPPPTLTLTASTNSVCTGTSATLIANSSSSSIYWTPAGTLSSSSASLVTASPGATTTYSVFVGAGSCTNSAVTTISVVPTPTLTVNSAAICAGKTATLTASGATSYAWSSGALTASTLVSPLSTTIYTVVGANGGICTSTRTTNVTVFDYPVVNSSIVTNVLCNGFSTGSIDINATGATVYTWPSVGSTTNSATGLAAGTYSCILSTGPSCSIVTTYSITEPTAVVGAITGTNTVCGQCNGVTTASATGGTGAFSYNWSPSASTQSIVTGLCPDTYIVTITDANNCVSSYSFDVQPSPVFQASVTASNTEIYQGETISLAGLGGVTYTWSPITALSCTDCAVTTANPLDDITYCVDVTSFDGCRDSACVDIIIKCGDVFVPNAFSPNNDGHNDELIVFGNCVKGLVFRIYDRWGALIFESFDMSNKWDGKYKGYSVTAGVFVYQLSAKLKSGEVVNKKGNITVVK